MLTDAVLGTEISQRPPGTKIWSNTIFLDAIDQTGFKNLVMDGPERHTASVTAFLQHPFLLKSSVALGSF